MSGRPCPTGDTCPGGASLAEEWLCGEASPQVAGLKSFRAVQWEVCMAGAAHSGLG